ncbi:specifically androgen-regulated gene protein isoform X2 [Echeneis naucrates]|nr:specifically androgen-regulated gene protein-like isoform X2 [Echeneis naucrates]XP_029363221.1 specifically androgen-regulated gene protein-like isoform X2 [Echeneis naucrates]
MEHLSAEERACLMYLEETIEALEVQEDSGLSNDEPESGPKVDDISSFKPDNFLRAENQDETSPESFPASAANMQNLMTQPKIPDTDTVTAGKIPSSATQARVLCISTDKDGKPKIVLSTEACPDQSTNASQIDVGLIPPPSDFMDKPSLHANPKESQDLLPSAGIPCNKPGATIDLELLCQRASAKKTSVSSSSTQEINMHPLELSHILSNSTNQISPPLEAAAPRSPPAVAPKPKRLPPNIVLKSHKASGAGLEGSSGHLVSPSSERMLDPQKVHIEALRKLGLLKSDEEDSGPALSPKLSPKTRTSGGAPYFPISSAAPHIPPVTPSNTSVSGPPPAFIPPQPRAALSPKANSASLILPAPAAFSDSVEHFPSDNQLSSAEDVPQAKVNAQVSTPPVRQLAIPKIIGVKSATIERSGLGLSSYMVSQDYKETGKGVGGALSPSQLRNCRPRPASLGSRKEFSSTQMEVLQPASAKSQESKSRRSMPAYTPPQNSGDSQKLPRSQGISVLICPRSENEEDRREALKKLGLLRD